MTAASGGTGADTNGSYWGISVYLFNGEHFCIDSLGASKETASRKFGGTVMSCN